MADREHEAALQDLREALEALHSQASDDPLRNPPAIPGEDLERAKVYVRKRGWVEEDRGENPADYAQAETDLGEGSQASDEGRE